WLMGGSVSALVPAFWLLVGRELQDLIGEPAAGFFNRFLVAIRRGNHHRRYHQHDDSDDEQLATAFRREPRRQRLRGTFGLLSSSGIDRDGHLLDGNDAGLGPTLRGQREGNDYGL